MRAVLGTGLLLLTAGCTFTIEKLVTDSPLASFTPAYGRAYFLKKGWFGSRVLVCDAQPAGGNVVCYESNAPR